MLSTNEKWFLATAVLGGVVALGGVLVGHSALDDAEKAYAIARERGEDLKAAKSLAVELQRRLNAAERRSEQPAGAPGTLAAANRNHLNIKVTAKEKPWKGQIGVDAQGHAVFDSVENGLRAAAMTLTSYYGKHGLDTLEGIVDRFCESNKVSYVKFLSEHMGLAPDEKFNVLSKLPILMRCMGRVESGTWLPARYFVGYDVAASAYQKGRDRAPVRTVVATVAPKPAPKPAAKPQAKKPQPRQVASK